jgi:hypothetical protein
VLVYVHSIVSRGSRVNVTVLPTTSNVEPPPVSDAEQSSVVAKFGPGSVSVTL